MKEPTPTLLERCRQGDTEAFARLVTEQQDYVYTLARRIVHDPEEAADLTQEVFVQVWRGLPSFRGAARFRTWLYRIVVNRGLNRLRKRRRERDDVSMDPQMIDSLAAAGNDPYTEAWQRERRAFIWEQVDRLPAKYRLAVALYYQQELSCAEVAQVLGLPLGTVKTHLYRARQALADVLAEEGYSGL